MIRERESGVGFDIVWFGGLWGTLLTGAERAVGMRTRLLARLERRGRPAYVSAYLKYVMTLRPRIGIGHPWGGLIGQAQAAVGPWKGEERFVCEGACGGASATVVRVYNTAMITMWAC